MNEAINSFTGGMMLDSHPMQTPNNVLSDALNATIITMNGDEFMLQLDMGNGRVESAFLPSGYVPIGVKEYGGIIYVACYNPLTLKGLVGSFPSPERNIDQSEAGGPTKALTWADFGKDGPWTLEGDTKGALNYKATVSLFPDLSKLLRPGDKFSVGITLDDDSKTPLSELLTKYKTIESQDTNLLTLRLAIKGVDGNLIDITDKLKHFSLEYLTLYTDNKLGGGKPYRKGQTLPNEIYTKDGNRYIGYFSMPTNYNDKKSVLDLQDYRDGKTSDLNVYNSKIAGPLYIIAELPSITSSSLTASGNVYKTEQTYNNTKISAGTYINISSLFLYDTPNTPYYFLGTEYTILLEEEDGTILPWEYNTGDKDSAGKYIWKPLENAGTQHDIEYVYKKDNVTSIELGIEIRSKETNLKGIVVITAKPSMMFGELALFNKSITLDLGRLGEGKPSINKWLFYTDNILKTTTITLGLEYYPKEGESMNTIGFKVYDYADWALNPTSTEPSYSFAVSLDSWHGLTSIDLPHGTRINPNSLNIIELEYKIIKPEKAIGDFRVDVPTTECRALLATEMFNYEYVNLSFEPGYPLDITDLRDFSLFKLKKYSLVDSSKVELDSISAGIPTLPEDLWPAVASLELNAPVLFNPAYKKSIAWNITEAFALSNPSWYSFNVVTGGDNSPKITWEFDGDPTAKPSLELEVTLSNFKIIGTKVSMSILENNLLEGLYSLKTDFIGSLYAPYFGLKGTIYGYNGSDYPEPLPVLNVFDAGRKARILLLKLEWNNDHTCTIYTTDTRYNILCLHFTGGMGEWGNSAIRMLDENATGIDSILLTAMFYPGKGYSALAPATLYPLILLGREIPVDTIEGVEDTNGDTKFGSIMRTNAEDPFVGDPNDRGLDIKKPLMMFLWRDLDSGDVLGTSKGSVDSVYLLDTCLTLGDNPDSFKPPTKDELMKHFGRILVKLDTNNTLVVYKALYQKSHSSYTYNITAPLLSKYLKLPSLKLLGSTIDYNNIKIVSFASGKISTGTPPILLIPECNLSNTKVITLNALSTNIDLSRYAPGAISGTMFSLWKQPTKILFENMTNTLYFYNFDNVIVPILPNKVDITTTSEYSLARGVERVLMNSTYSAPNKLHLNVLPMYLTLFFKGGGDALSWQYPLIMSRTWGGSRNTLAFGYKPGDFSEHRPENCGGVISGALLKPENDLRQILTKSFPAYTPVYLNPILLNSIFNL